MRDKTIYMQMGDDTTHEQEQGKVSKGLDFMKHEAKEELAEAALEKMSSKLLDGVEMVQIGGGMATVTIPLALVNIMSSLFKQLENDIEKGGMGR